MVDAADATLRRLEAYDSSQGEELTEESLRKAGVPEDLVDGLIKSKEHYAEFDTEAYRVWILKAFSRALGNSEEDSGPDFSEFMSYLIYLEEDGSTMLYSDAKKNSITIASWALYRHQISTHTSFQGIMADENCPFFGITQKRIRDKHDIIEVLNNDDSVLLSYSGCKTGIDNKTQNDFISFNSNY